ncbi:carboxypeptidase-like regulatory domain-containing protein [Dactylosporangium cerinum]|uniref:Carboxypeptidase-like regulatory domain-containing protein n=1 Tax=Dactylosporangium cerinum TaxID=1434730 RepID=A0ABV9VRA2_9ACTN
MNDEALGEALQSLWRTGDPVPDLFVRAGFEALAWRNFAGALARLVDDTAATGRELAHVRGGAARLLTFERDDVTVVLELSTDDGVLRLLGQLDPPVPADVTVEAPAGTRTTRADDRGRFQVDRLPAGRHRVAVTFDDGVRLVTEWFDA